MRSRMADDLAVQGFVLTSDVASRWASAAPVMTPTASLSPMILRSPMASSSDSQIESASLDGFGIERFARS